MAQQSMSIIDAVDDLNESIFLPAIQREFVWDADQIVRLFDSVMREYPIGSFLVWKLKGDAAADQIKYRFVRHYIEDSVYPESPDFDQLDHHNPKVPVQEETTLPDTQRLVLDGQQRLTAFYIGLQGSFTEKRKFAQYKNPNAWTQKQLYLNLFSDPEQELEDELGLRYEFMFKKEAPEPTEDAYWFPVSEIQGADTAVDAMQMTDDLRIEDFPKEKRYDAQQNLHTLFAALADDARIQYHEETTEDQERVLDIFVRTNEGGTPLSKSEILLSMATARWTESESESESLNAREEITSFVDRLNQYHEEKGFSFSTDFVLKSLLVLSDLPPEYRIANFTNANLGQMKREWLETTIQDDILAALDLVVEFGLDSQSLTSSNALIPIAYYIHHHDPDLSWESKAGSENRRRVHYWLTSALLNGTFNSRPDEVLQDAREAIQESGGEFPLEEIHHQMRGRGKVVGFSPDVIESLLDETTYRSQKSFLLLSLLYYPEPVKQNVTYQRDHIFPKSVLDVETLVDEYGLSVETAQRCENRRDVVANLQLLTPNENAEKSDVDFEEWISTRTDEYYERHLIPTEERLHRIENFPEFVERREQLIRENVSEKFSNFE
ncbi:DUF262 domain-containing protein (plasmid) [Halarchaeum sp. CBA1220]|uniref:DUF262 domain-containing protein n=1 Tax=Halarchaeum sp. CBA1220 TaxID=1853682 RepID=UPI000F3A9F07|nr:DUF262 domain-containing protein [Halarchaeum sp. CBA1220]QLC35582.1 DUF262 domain-containing protein [Halarchaeum sp. CBA1220]